MIISHIYIEEEILNHPKTVEIINKFPYAKRININNYKNVFNPSNQNFQVQKYRKKLILAKRRDQFFYPGSPITDTFNRGKFYYNTLVMNCPFNCDYCYLQGMYNSSHIVVFVNLEDYFQKTIELLEVEKSLTLCISYDTDLLALERILSYSREWILFAEKNPGLQIEIRTKSNAYSLISDLHPTPNVILAWTLSPVEIVKSYEHDTPTLTRRIESIKSSIIDGWTSRLCFDPILYVNRWKKLYSELFSQVFSFPELGGISEVTFGVFRINSEYLKKIKKMRNDSDILYYPFKKVGTMQTYSKEIEYKMKKYIYSELIKYVSEDKIYY